MQAPPCCLSDEEELEKLQIKGLAALKAAVAELNGTPSKSTCNTNNGELKKDINKNNEHCENQKINQGFGSSEAMRVSRKQRPCYKQLQREIQRLAGEQEFPQTQSQHQGLSESYIQSQDPDAQVCVSKVMQLYKIDNNPKRKEFLDDLLNLLKKHGTPIKRTPIMANKVLDLHKLYELVAERGGLREVQKNKLWPEIAKILTLENSVRSPTSKLRMKYIKYLSLYEYENRSRRILETPHTIKEGGEGERWVPKQIPGARLFGKHFSPDTSSETERKKNDVSWSLSPILAHLHQPETDQAQMAAQGPSPLAGTAAASQSPNGQKRGEKRFTEAIVEKDKRKKLMNMATELTECKCTRHIDGILDIESTDNFLIALECKGITYKGLLYRQ
ncbi:AT-rich interactive domain-containing protein 3A-like [Ornithorhynchus anatinus]|uniref:AT-rich interactive domain-containing protein 3 n=1 Tax=Ornithorhynchus anatinus TaxID=9258 RepID=K7EAI7_ORNAN|nr:AT-rich interactive domain-containing protein 3A-like [Ornithorhynchus anatinus]